MHIKLTNGKAAGYSIAQLHRDNPQVSFPQDIPAETLATFGVYPLAATEQPQFDSSTQNMAEAEAVQVGEQWVQVWQVSPASAEEIAERAAEQGAFVRAQRNALLTASDWTQLPDVSLETKDAWAIYRQALRGVTKQAGFPYSVEWPKAP